MGVKKRRRVNLEYFKPTGKWYASGSFFVVPDLPLYKIWERVEEKSRTGMLPGLAISKTPFDYLITINVPGHPNEHPHLMIP